MFGESILKALPRGFFNWPLSTEDRPRGHNPLSVVVIEERKRRSKRCREDDPKRDAAGGSRTPTLISPTRGFSCGDVQPPDSDDAASDRPLKRFRGQSKVVAVSQQPVSAPKKAAQQQKSEFLSTVPEDVVAHCLSFLGTAEDRFALQTTCKLFRDISNTDAMLAKVNVGGDQETGKLGIIQDDDTPATAASGLAPFARAGNLEALYM
jgi:hypothetical protein